MAKWQKSQLRMAKNHVWRTEPGYKILVLDRGAARVDIPEEWSIAPGEGCLEVRDKENKDDAKCLFQITVFPAIAGVNWGELPLAPLLEQAMEGSGHEIISRGPIETVSKPDLEVAWRETHFVDPEEHREAITCTCFARGANIHILISYSFWPEDERELRPHWAMLLRSLRLGEYRDPATGQRLRPREN